MSGAPGEPLGCDWWYFRPKKIAPAITATMMRVLNIRPIIGPRAWWHKGLSRRRVMLGRHAGNADRLVRAAGPGAYARASRARRVGPNDRCGRRGVLAGDEDAGRPGHAEPQSRCGRHPRARMGPGGGC